MKYTGKIVDICKYELFYGCVRDICEFSYTIVRLPMNLLLSLIEDIKINLIIRCLHVLSTNLQTHKK